MEIYTSGAGFWVFIGRCAPPPNSHKKIKKRCAWKKEHETLRLEKGCEGSLRKKEEKGLRLEVGDLYFGGRLLI